MVLLRVKEIVKLTGWSQYRVLRLINLGKLRAVNTGTGSTPRWEVREEELNAFLTPVAPVIEPPVTRRPPRIDAGVEDYFGSRIKPRPDVVAD